MDQKKQKRQKKNGYGKRKHYANRMGRHIKKNKKHGRRPLRTPIPYYFATQTPSYMVPIQDSSNLLPAIEPIINPTQTFPLEPLSLPPQPTLLPTLSPTPTLLPLPSPLSLASISTPTLVYDYTYTQTPEYTPALIPVPGPTPEPVSIPVQESAPESTPAPQVDGDAIQITSNEIPQEEIMPEDPSSQQQEQQITVPDQSNETGDDYPETVVVDSNNEEESVSTVSAAAAISRESNNSQLNNGTLASPNQTMQIAGPIIGIVGVMALVAAAMFLVVKRQRKRRIVQSDSHNKEPRHQYQHHQEKERVNDDEAYYFEIPKDSSYAPVVTPGAPPTQMPSLAPTSKFYSKNNKEQQQQHKEESDDDQSNDENRFSRGTGTLVGSQSTSRTNSMKEQKLKHMSVSSWYSAASSLLSLDTPPLPLSGTLVKNNLMLAERQQLQHERPSILDHWKKPIFIETYRAQLADLNDINDSN